MFKRMGNKIVEAEEGFSVEHLGRDDLLYTQGDKIFRVSSDLLIGGPYTRVIYANSITHWKSGEVIEEEAKRKVVENIKRAFAWEGSQIDVQW